MEKTYEEKLELERYLIDRFLKGKITALELATIRRNEGLLGFWLKR